jgi:tetratricopeptide (TPR) repeat protein
LLEFRDIKETFSFLTKLFSVHRIGDDNHFPHALSQSFAQLGEIEHQLNNLESAIKYFKRALQIEPNNPRYLDLLLHFSIMVKDKKLAQRTLRQLKETNPDNNKIEEFEQKINEI